MDVVYADAVAVLANRRIVLQFLHLRFVVAAEPGIARVYLGMNRDRARSPVPHGDVAGASEHYEVDGAVNLEQTVKGSDDGSEASQRASQNKNQRSNGSMPSRENDSHIEPTP